MDTGKPSSGDTDCDCFSSRSMAGFSFVFFLPAFTVGFRVLGVRVLGFKGLGFRGLGFGGLAFRV